MFKIISQLVFINFVVLSTAQECNPRVVEWFPHQYSCQKFIICFHGNAIGLSQFWVKTSSFIWDIKILQNFRALQDFIGMYLRGSVISRLKLGVTSIIYALLLTMKQILSSYPIGSIAKSNIEKSLPHHKILIFTINFFQLFCMLQRKSDSTVLCGRALVGFRSQLVHYCRFGHVRSENRKQPRKSVHNWSNNNRHWATHCVVMLRNQSFIQQRKWRLHKKLLHIQHNYWLRASWGSM